MATDFAEYANLRFRWTRTNAPANLRNGVPTAGTTYVLQAFVKASAPSPDVLPQLTAGQTVLSGYLTAYATLPNGTSWLAAASAFSWTETGLAPDGLLAGAEGRALLGRLESLPTVAPGGVEGKATIRALQQPFGIGGIGAELRTALGDKVEFIFSPVT